MRGQIETLRALATAYRHQADVTADPAVAAVMAAHAAVHCRACEAMDAAHEAALVIDALAWPEGDLGRLRAAMAEIGELPVTPRSGQ